MRAKKFDFEYKRLNPEQKKAVDTVEGTVMVVAGPGTGKTQILSLRIANILRQTDTAPENILALTFTTAGVFSMRKRLVEIIGSEAYRINIYTFHSFCEMLVNEYGEEFQKILGAKLISEIDQLKIIEDIIEKGDFKLLRPWGDRSYYVNSLPAIIGELKKATATVDKFKELVSKQEKDFLEIEDLRHTKGKFEGEMKGKHKTLEKSIAKNKELSIVYEKYQERLGKQKLYDYDDVILETIDALEKHKDFLSELQEKYQYILVDEHQDTNDSQNRILELLTDFFDRPNLFVVGDEKQAIYRFQGASLENFLFFKNKYKDVTSVDLVENYRSTQNILDSAHSLIAKNQNADAKLNKKLKSVAKEKGAKISVFPFSNAEFELAFLAEDIKTKINGGIKLNEIAIFYRNNNEVVDIARMLEKKEIPFVIESKQDILSDPDIFKILLLMKATNYLGNNAWLGQVLYIDFLGIDSLDIYKLIQFSQKQKTPLFDCIASEKILEKIGVGDWKTIFNFYKKLEVWKKSAMNKDLISCLEDIIYQSGYFNYILESAESADKLNKLNKFFDEAKKLTQENKNFKLVDFIQYLELLENYNLSIKTKNNELFEGVRLMTAHGAKGLEFDVVYIFNAIDKHWGNKPLRHKFKLPIKSIEQNNDDERRLFFVALTRARQEAIITYSKKRADGKDQMPSQFLAEIDSELIKEIDVAELETGFARNINNFAMKKGRNNMNIKDKEYLNKLFLTNGLNATAVNNYLACPWKYFFNNLIKIPKAYNKNMAYGNVVHKSLEEFFENFRQGKKADRAILLKIFTNNIEKDFLNEKDVVEALEKGLCSLGGYYDQYHGSWHKNILNELNIKGVPVKIDDDFEISLSGKLDKVEILEGGKVNVVDYKTGRVGSKNKLEGKTKDATGDYKRQLVFYKLLLDKYNNGQYDMLSGEIDFVEPNENGKYKKEKFEIGSDEARALEEQIKNISREILSLSFWNAKCDKKDCEFCKLRKILSLRAF